MKDLLNSTNLTAEQKIEQIKQILTNHPKLTIEIYKTTEKQPFRFRVESNNHEPIAYGESYTTKQECNETIALLQAGMFFAEIKDLTL